MKKTLLVVSGGLEAVPGIRRAQEMGLHVVVSDGNAAAPGFAIADDTIFASTYDVDATVAAAREYSRTRRRIDGVITIAADVPLTVASVAKALDLAGIPVESAVLAMDKLLMKERFASDGIAIPWFSAVRDSKDLKQIVAAQGFPLVLKPVDSRGARGVLRLAESVDLEWAFAESQSQSPTGRVMAERFLPGPQVSTESLVIRGTAYTPGFSDRNYDLLERYAPYMIENGGDFPTTLSTEDQAAVREIVQRAAASLGVRDGVVKGDIVVSDGRPYVIELATRLSGGYFCTHTIPLNSGVDVVGNAIRLALGLPVDPEVLRSKYNHPVSQRYFFPEPGRVTRVSGAQRFRNHPEVAYLELRVKEGDIVHPISSHLGRAGVVMTTGITRAEATELAERVTRDIEIDTRPAA